jgi:hypothetical protein
MADRGLVLERVAAALGLREAARAGEQDAGGEVGDQPPPRGDITNGTRTVHGAGLRAAQRKVVYSNDVGSQNESPIWNMTLLMRELSALSFASSAVAFITAERSVGSNLSMKM